VEEQLEVAGRGEFEMETVKARRELVVATGSSGQVVHGERMGEIWEYPVLSLKGALSQRA
jgi:hypothetical protein